MSEKLVNPPIQKETLKALSSSAVHMPSHEELKREIAKNVLPVLSRSSRLSGSVFALYESGLYNTWKPTRFFWEALEKICECVFFFRKNRGLASCW